MNLDAALTEIAAFLDLDDGALLAYAQSDDIGGYHSDATQAKWMSGSLWECEGKTLYALVRALRPAALLELGVHVGASTTHLRSAVQANLDGGWVYSVDRLESAGALIPAYLSDYGNITYDWALQYISRLPDNSIDFAFEDLCHGAGEVYDVITALLPKLRKGAVVVHHDSEHGDDGVQVKRGIALAGVVNWRSWLIDPADTGIALWVAP